jgi:hypothetical protein
MDSGPLYGGIADARMPVASFDLGAGVTLSSAEAHLMRPFLMTYRRPESSFPAMMAATGSFGFDVVAELYLPENFQRSQWFDRANTIWWLAALLRLRATPRLRVPVLSDASFSDLSFSRTQRFWPVELEADRTKLIFDASAGDAVSIDDLTWVRDHWLEAGRLMHQKRELNTLFQAFDQCSHARDPLLALLLMWSSLEGMFSPARTELRFRIALNLASFLEPPGPSRAGLQKECAKLYDARSAAAHGKPDVALEPLTETYLLIKRVLMKIIETNHVPTGLEIEEAVLHGR